MAAQSILVMPYYGALLEAQLLSSAQTIVLGDFGSASPGILGDADGLLSDADNGTATFNGDPISYIGSGTATPGVNIAGITVPLGAPVDMVAFEAAGQVYFHYPDGPPDLLSAVALVVDLNSDPYQVFTPLCLLAGTLIATPEGEVPVETLMPGDLVSDVECKSHQVLWSVQRELEVPDRPRFEKWRPVRVRAGAFGPETPYIDTFLSQQHAVLVDGSWVRKATGRRAGLARAVHLLNGSSVRLARGKTRPVYCHVLCAEHVVLRANGLPVESLRLTSEAGSELDPDQLAAVRAQFPELVDRMAPAAPMLSRHEAKAVSHQAAATWMAHGRAPVA